MKLDMRPVRVAAGEDGDGRLVFWEEALVAVLVRLSAQHEELAGAWYLEAGFGEAAVPLNPTFDDLDEAGAWITSRLEQRSTSSPYVD